jgi:hypothetical protein
MNKVNLYLTMETGVRSLFSGRMLCGHDVLSILSLLSKWEAQVFPPEPSVPIKSGHRLSDHTG